MRVLLTTTLGRLQLALTAVVVPLLVIKLVVLRVSPDPSLGTSLLFAAIWPLLIVQLTLGFAARGNLMHRDWLAFAMAMAGALTLGASGVVDDHAFDAIDTLLDLTGVFLGLTIACLIWSASGRRPRTA